MAPVKTYNVRAEQWRGGWELHIEGEGVTQSRTLATAEQQVRDYIASMHGLDEVRGEVRIDLGELDAKAEEAKRATREADEATRAAARKTREVVADFRSKGLSVSDISKVLGVSRGRVSQLVETPRKADEYSKAVKVVTARGKAAARVTKAGKAAQATIRAGKAASEAVGSSARQDVDI